MGAGPVGALGYGDTATVYQQAGITRIQFVLGGAGQRQVTGHAPGFLPGEKLYAVGLGILAETAPAPGLEIDKPVDKGIDAEPKEESHFLEDPEILLFHFRRRISALLQ